MTRLNPSVAMDAALLSLQRRRLALIETVMRDGRNPLKPRTSAAYVSAWRLARRFAALQRAIRRAAPLLDAPAEVSESEGR